MPIRSFLADNHDADGERVKSPAITTKSSSEGCRPCLPVAGMRLPPLCRSADRLIYRQVSNCEQARSEKLFTLA